MRSEAASFAGMAGALVDARGCGDVSGWECLRPALVSLAVESRVGESARELGAVSGGVIAIGAMVLLADFLREFKDD